MFKIPALFSSRLRVSLALQGGGSFGAFTWGVLDRLLEEPNVEFDTISGASAGAVNAVLVASGLANGGREVAREKLERFWSKASAMAPSAPLARITGMAGDFFRTSLSPYQFNPFDLNPLRTLLSAEVDFEAINSHSPVHLMISATRVSDGQMQIFRSEDLDVDRLLASTCLPMLHHTVYVDGEAYWDGGYVANPPLLELITESKTHRVLVVQITPMRRAALPKTPREIMSRLDQISFNSSLMREIESIEMLRERALTEFGSWSRTCFRMRRLQMDRISAEDSVPGLDEASATDLDWSFLTMLRDSGRDVADAWLAKHMAHPREVLSTENDA